MFNRGAAFPGLELKRALSKLSNPCPDASTSVLKQMLFIYTILSRCFNFFVPRFYHLKMGIRSHRTYRVVVNLCRVLTTALDT